MLITNTRKKDKILNHVPYIYYLVYLVYFEKNSNNIEALINSSYKFNNINLIYISNLDLQI